MVFILNIETATRNCSVALARDGEVIAVREITGEGYLHAEKLHIFIQNVVADSGITMSALTAVAVSMGPGSYTGLRIGVSAAKGLCYALSLPLIAIDTLEVLARQADAGEGEVIIPMIDARRMEAYTAVFNPAYIKLRDTQAEVIAQQAFQDFPGRVHFVGDGAAKCKEILSGPRFIYHDDILFPSAMQMGVLSHEKYKKSDTVDVAYFEPYYLKDFISGKN